MRIHHTQIRERIMAKTILQGKWAYQVRGMYQLLKISWQVIGRRLIRQPLVAGWSITFEIGTLFYRAQFNHAFALPDIREGRAYFDAVTTVASPDLPVKKIPAQAIGQQPAGDWHIPHGASTDTGPVVLYCHGGGYTFYAEATRQFIAMLAHLLQLPLFAVDYRLTPEHPFPAQRDDALAAYRYLLAQGIAPQRIVLAGDSAGGHLVLMTLAQLKAEQLPQPALAIGLSPWTDTGLRGASQFGHDRYDMVQGYQTVQFARWLKGNTGLSDAAISPIYQSFAGCAPVYLQAGGKEILVDMIRDFASTLDQQQAAVMLDVWPDMTHEFHAYGDTLPESQQAIRRIRNWIDWSQDQRQPLPAILPVTERAAHLGTH